MPVHTVFLGTFTGGPGGGMEMDGPPSASEGIYTAQFDDETGQLDQLKLVAEVGVSPSWFRWHPTLPVLYTNNETFDGSASSVTAFRLTAALGLERMSRVSTGGGSCCHLSVHPAAAHIGAANHGQDFGAPPYPPGSTAVISLDPATGDLAAQTALVEHQEPSEQPAGRDSRRRQIGI
jgi:6-phosphogluconolactonase (cycloisomerase 2 family)